MGRQAQGPVGIYLMVSHHWVPGASAPAEEGRPTFSRQLPCQGGDYACAETLTHQHDIPRRILSTAFRGSGGDIVICSPRVFEQSRLGRCTGRIAVSPVIYREHVTACQLLVREWENHVNLHVESVRECAVVADPMIHGSGSCLLLAHRTWLK